jgi:hypothetical protein
VLDTWTEAEVYFAATLGKSKPITVLRAKWNESKRTS